MKREQVMAMTDSDLRIEVAKLTGATDFAYNPYDENRIQAYWPENDKGDGEGWREIPDYPNDIAAAWELLEHCPPEWWIDCKTHNRAYECSILLDSGEVNPHYASDSEKMDRAITRAFILAMEAK